MRAGVVAILAAFAMTNGAGAAATYSVKLSSQDRESITTAACAAAGVQHIEATTTRRGSANVEATVRCQSHRTEGRMPVAHQSTCHNRTGKWVCANGEDALQVTVREKTVVAVVAHGIELAAAADAVTRASKMTYPPFTEQAWPIFHGTCSVGVVPSPGYAGLTRFAIDCTGGKVEMHRLCWKDGCRHFIVSGDRAAP